MRDMRRNYGVQLMKCPQCGGRKLLVKDSRREDDVVSRVRRCACGVKIKTVEHIVETILPKRNKRALSVAEAIAKKRGCWVPASKENDWRLYKAAGYTAEEARVALGLPKYEPTETLARRIARSRKAKAAGMTSTH